jgi:hypothetical protein
MRAWFTWGFVATAGTDTHDQNVGVYPTVFPDNVTTFAGVVEGIKAGTCRPFLKSKRYRHFMS